MNSISAGIVTLLGANSGYVLQRYALQQALQKQGANVLTLTFAPSGFILPSTRRLRRLLSFEGTGILLRKLINIPGYVYDRFIEKRQRLNKNDIFKVQDNF